MQLRDGSTTQDPRLGRIVDPQTPVAQQRYPMHRLLQEVQLNPLRSYTWRVDTWLDQGYEGACVGFSFCHELAARPKVVKGITDEQARHAYWEIQKIDPWAGGAWPGAEPFYEGTSTRSGAEYFRSKGRYKSYWWANSEDDIARAVGYRGPVVIGVNWYEGMMEPSGRNYTLEPTGALVGGHAILVNSFSKKLGLYGLWNSWGQDWGRVGQATITRETMSRLLNENGDAVIPIR